MPKFTGPWSHKRAERAAQVEVNESVFGARDEARAHLAKCNTDVAAQHEQVARLDRLAVLAVGDDAALDAALADLNAARLQLQKLELAQRAAVEKLQLAEQAAHELDAQNRREPVRRGLKKLRATAAAYEASAADTEVLRRQLYDDAESVRLLWPGARPPVGALLYPNPLTRAIDAHAYRISANPFRGAGLPPIRVAPTQSGAQCPDLRLKGQPERVPSITAAIAEAAEGLLAQLEKTPLTVREPAPAATVEEGFSKPVPSRADDGRTYDPVTGVEVISGQHLAVKKS